VFDHANWLSISREICEESEHTSRRNCVVYFGNQYPRPMTFGNGAPELGDTVSGKRRVMRTQLPVERNHGMRIVGSGPSYSCQ
jgi:hypothetical protein